MSAFRTPRGTQDRLPVDEALFEKIVDAFAATCRAHGFGRIQSPTFEDAGLFTRSVGEETDLVSKEMYVFQDRSGDDLALRPEGTAPVVRAYNQHGMKSLPQPVRLYYVTPIFRYDRPQAGRYREHNQIGAEVLGESDAHVDVELVALIWDLLAGLGLRNLELNVNSIGDRQCRPGYLRELVNYYRPRAEELCDDCKVRLERNPMRLLDCKKEHCHEIAEGAPRTIDHLCEECAGHFEDLKAGLGALGIAFAVNPHVVRGLDYYTRTVFEIWPAGVGGQSTLAGGGRYDLLSEFIGGDPLPGMGFGSGIERIMLNIREQGLDDSEPGAPDVFVAALSSGARGPAAKLAATLRLLGVIAISGYREASPRAHLRKANSMGARVAALIGDRDLEAGTVAIRNMESSAQETVAAAEAPERVRELLKRTQAS